MYNSTYAMAVVQQNTTNTQWQTAVFELKACAF